MIARNGRAWLILALLLVCNVVCGGPFSRARAGSIYDRWKNGPPTSADFFPIAVWWQNPAVREKSGAYPTIGRAAAAMDINIILGVGAWPERYGNDDGELAAAKDNGLYVIGGIDTPWDENNSAQSVSSVLALAKTIGASRNVIGYNAGDEPTCKPDTMQYVPGMVHGINSYDPTRVVTYNQTTWMISPEWLGSCAEESFAALQSTSIGSFDFYPETGPWFPQVFQYPKGDFISIPNDSLWVQGMATAALIHAGLPDQPEWVFIEAGGDNLGFSSGNANFAGALVSGSTTLTNLSEWSVFTSTWLGLTVAGGGIPAGTKITSIIDGTHATLSAAATSTSASESIAVTGGAGGKTDCVASANLCVVNGNEFRPTAAQVNAEVWMSLINGANGIEYFCHDTLSDFFCMGDLAGGEAATLTQANVSYINHGVHRFAEVLNAPTVGICSMQVLNYVTGARSTVSSCTNGILLMSTANSAVPGMALVKQLGKITYLLAQSDRRSPNGARFSYTLAGLAAKKATIVYDSDEHYDDKNAERGAVFGLDLTGTFTDVLGQHGDDYQVKIYAIQ